MTLAVLIVAGVSYALMQSLVLPALPEIQKALGASSGATSWIFAAYLLSASVATPIVGRLGDLHGNRRMLIIALSFMAGGTLVSAVAGSAAVMIAGRVVQGVGGGVFPLAFGIIRAELPAERVPQGIGLVSSLLGVGGGLGVVLAGPIVEATSYHFLFWLPFGVIVTATIAAAVLVPEGRGLQGGGVNWKAASLMSSGLLIILLGVTQATAWGWVSWRMLAAVAGGAAALAAWVFVEARARVPLVDMRMMRQRAIWTTNLAGFLVGAGLYATFVLLPRFVQEPTSTGYGFGTSLLAAGVFLIPATLIQVVIGEFTGVIDRRVGSRIALLAGAVLAAAGLVVLAVTGTERWEVFVSSGLLGCGVGLSWAALSNLIVSSVPADQTGVATGVNTVMRTIGGAVGVQITATMLAGSVGLAGMPSQQGYRLAFGVCAAAFAASAVVGALIARRARTRAAMPSIGPLHVYCTSPDDRLVGVLAETS